MGLCCMEDAKSLGWEVLLYGTGLVLLGAYVWVGCARENKDADVWRTI